jgi:hypothetical protein
MVALMRKAPGSKAATNSEPKAVRTTQPASPYRERLLLLA